LAGAQNADFQFRLYDFDDGMTHRNVFKIQQDQAGYIWLATINGLNRFDGHEFAQYSTDQPTRHIPNNFLTDMLIDSTDQIWLGCGHELVVLDARSGAVAVAERAEEGPDYRKEDFRFYNMFMDRHRNLWTAAHEERRGKVFLDKKAPDAPLRHWQQLPGQYFQRPMAETAEGLWLGAYDGELWFSDGVNPFVLFQTFEGRQAEGQPARIVQLQTTPDGTLWVLLSNGKVYFKAPGLNEFRPHPVGQLLPADKSALSFLVDGEKNIWIGGYSSLWFYRASSGELVSFEAQLKEFFDHTTTLRQIFMDKTGVIWVATDFGALSIHPVQKLFAAYLNGGHEFCRDGTCSMRGITEDDQGNIYVSYYHSIHVLNPRTGEMHPLFRNNRYFQIPFSLTWYDGALWTGEGLKIDLKTLETDTVFTLPKDMEGVNMVDSTGQIWFGCADNLCIYDPKDDNLRSFEDPSGFLDTVNTLVITYLYQSRDTDIIWVGTRENGLLKVSKTRGTLARYDDSPKSPARLTHPRILALVEDGRQNLWIGTGDGLNKLHIPTEKLTVYSTKNGLPNDFINGLLLEGDSAIWVSTDRGLARLDTESGEVVSFFESDGLTRNEFNRISFYKSKDGRFYFGGLNGVNAFYPGPQFVQKAKNPPQGNLLLTAFSKFDGKLDSLVELPVGTHPTEPIRLSWRDRFFTFRFSLADYADPRTHEYAFKLDGYEAEWSPPSNLNFARYNDIPAGKYTFRVRARVHGGEWGAHELTVPIIIEQAYFKSWWFWGICGLIALSVFYGILRYRLYLAAERRKILEHLVQERTAELELEKHKSDELLLNILPAELAEELKENGSAKARRHNSVTVFFSDFKNFVKIAEKMEPEELVAQVDYLFRAFDEIISANGLEKIKTIGDAYMCVGGILNNGHNEAVKVVKAALEIQAFMKAVEIERRVAGLPFFEARIGIHTGPVVAGIVGIKKFAYDIWGDTVNIAARMEQTGEPGEVNISATTYELVKDYFECTYRGKITAKNKGEIDMYFVKGIKRALLNVV